MEGLTSRGSTSASNRVLASTDQQDHSYDRSRDQQRTLKDPSTSKQAKPVPLSGPGSKGRRKKVVRSETMKTGTHHGMLYRSPAMAETQAL